MFEKNDPAYMRAIITKYYSGCNNKKPISNKVLATSVLYQTKNNINFYNELLLKRYHTGSFTKPFLTIAPLKR